MKGPQPMRDPKSPKKILLAVGATTNSMSKIQRYLPVVLANDSPIDMMSGMSEP